MSTKLTSLKEALLENARLMEALLQQEQYDEALQCMDTKLALLADLAQLAQDDPAQQQDIAALASILSVQEEQLTALATSHHHAIFQQLAQVGRASRAGQAYRVNSKEF